jgi:D-galactarolactone cycloisomerase
VHKLLGGAFRREVAPYATGFYRREGEDPVEAGVREASQRLAEDFGPMKLKLGFGVEADIEYVRAVCEAVGSEVRLLMDANCAYDVPAARRVLLGVEGAGVYLFEEPLAPEDLEGYRSLRGLTATLSGAGGNLFGKIGFRRWVSEGAFDVLQPDLCSSGASPSAKR